MIVKKFQTQIIITIAAVVFFSLSVVFFLIEYRIRDELQKSIEANAISLLESTLNTIEIQYEYITAYKESIINRQKNDLRHYSDIVFSFIGDIDKEYLSGKISEKEARKKAADFIRDIRYNGGVGYFWINDTGRPYPRMIMHPTIPDLDGKILDKREFCVAEGAEKNLFKAFVKVCMEKGEGYVEYKWPKPVKDGVTEYRSKISFVRLYKPWNWIIGTGAYMDDLEKEVDFHKDLLIKRLNSILSKQRIGENGYFFIFDKNNMMLVHPSLAGVDVSNVKDIRTGRYLVDEFKEAAKKKNFMLEYYRDKPGEEGNYIYAKKAFIRYYEPLGWYIGSSVYKDDFEEIISHLTGSILLIFMFFILIALFISILVSRKLVSPINRLIIKIGEKDSDGLPSGEFPEDGPEEIRMLSSTLNELLTSARKSREHYKHLFDNALVGIFRIRLGDGLFLEVNAKAAELLGLPPEDIVGKLTTRELYKNPEDRDVILERLKRDGEVIGYEFEMVMSDGREATYTNSIKLYPEEGYIEGIVVDISKVKLVEKEKARLQEQLVHHGKMEAIGQLAGGIAHDFNNVLAGIMGAAQLLNSPRRSLDEKSKELVDMIMKASLRAADLTAKLLAFGRKGRAVFEGIDIHSIIQDTVSILEKTINKSVRINMKLSASERIAAGDKSGIQNALINMGINSAFAMGEGGTLYFETSNIYLGKEYCSASPFDIEPGLFIDITVRDTGCGIKQENLDRIFEPFFTTKEQGQGTGLGLAAVYGTIQDHHGSIDVISELGKGTEFHIYLPCTNREVKLENAGEGVIRGTGTILLVDDEELIRVTGKAILEDFGYRVLLAENGLEAVEIFKSEYKDIDLVIMDMIMPEMGGTKAFYRMKEIDQEVKIIIASGFADNENLDSLKESGLSGFITKPFKSDELSRIIARIIVGGS